MFLGNVVFAAWRRGLKGRFLTLVLKYLLSCVCEEQLNQGSSTIRREPVMYSLRVPPLTNTSFSIEFPKLKVTEFFFNENNKKKIKCNSRAY